jgi:hypothetical protein
MGEMVVFFSQLAGFYLEGAKDNANCKTLVETVNKNSIDLSLS